MKTLRIKFVDFWYGFDPKDNYFTELLSLKYKLELSDAPEILIFSNYGQSHLNYNCIKVFYSAENRRPEFSGCDFAITFDYNKDPRHYRLPLYAMYIDRPGLPERLAERISNDEALKLWRQKTKFCCMVVSNGSSQERINFFERLSTYKKVDSGGKTLNNVGGPVPDKLEFIKDYRFVIAFENSSHAGYTTEKIAEPFITNCIPLYWGDPLVKNDFNEKSFLVLDKNKTTEELIEEIISIDNDEKEAIRILAEPKFANGKIPQSIIKENVATFFVKIVSAIEVITPVAKTSNKYLYLYKIRRAYYLNRIKGILNTILLKIKRQ